MKKQKFVTNSSIKDRQQFQIVRRSQKDIIGVKTEDGREIPFGEKSRAAEITDAGLAREIHDSVGQGGTGDVLVIPKETRPNPTHRRTFVVPALPWHKEDD